MPSDASCRSARLNCGQSPGRWSVRISNLFVCVSHFTAAVQPCTLGPRPSCRGKSMKGTQMTFGALKERQSIAWSSAPYEQVSEQHLSAIEALLDRLELRPGERLLDVATGTGELARPAAARGLQV